VSEIAPYEAGRPIEDVARSLGADPDQIIKLASNESPLPPFDPVIEAIAAAAGSVNRYPDNGWYELSRAVANHLGVDPDQLIFGGGSSEILRVIALAVGGPATSAVYAWPSFIIYRLASIVAGTDRIEVPLTHHFHDPEAMLAAIRPDTTVAYLCNPNNPTGTYLSGAAVAAFVEAVPDRVLVVVDEAYFEYVTASDYATALSLSLERPNLVVTRTFSKIYGLAALRVGYAVGQASTLRELRRAQAPFTVNSLAQVAALTALRYPGQVAARARVNHEERARIEKELAARQLEYVPSQANFVYLRAGSGAASELLTRGVIVRAMEEDWIRVTVGTVEENDRFLTALDQLGPLPT
jgi:histidinol-phosphate aminotransferase